MAVVAGGPCRLRGVVKQQWNGCSKSISIENHCIDYHMKVQSRIFLFSGNTLLEIITD
jgi:hypothetical protein